MSFGLRDALSFTLSEGDLCSADDLVVEVSVAAPLSLYESAVVLCFEELARCFRVILVAIPGAYCIALTGCNGGKVGRF